VKIGYQPVYHPNPAHAGTGEINAGWPAPTLPMASVAAAFMLQACAIANDPLAQTEQMAGCVLDILHMTPEIVDPRFIRNETGEIVELEYRDQGNLRICSVAPGRWSLHAWGRYLRFR
jgi:hypothetical protein